MALKVRRAMVLAAGYGTRLRPLTDYTPKPLVPVAGKPMIEYALDKLRAYGIEEVVVNVSHLKEQLLAYFDGLAGMTVRISVETEPLETGGGLKQALPMLGAEPFFVINSDIIWTDGKIGALENLAGHWDDSRMDLLLLVQPRAKAIGYDQGEDHIFIKPENTIGWNDEEAPYIIAGVGIMHPHILAKAPAGMYSIKVLWQEALRNNRLFCLPHQGGWYQTGSVADIKRAEAILYRP
jgi:N-acetyl-alpha-D-muramate 1-phosphate uridylyltransferase